MEKNFKKRSFGCFLFLLVLSSSAQGFRANIAFWQKRAVAGFSKTLDGNSVDNATGIAVSNGYVYVTGTFTNSSTNGRTVTDFSGAVLNGKTATTNNFDMFVAKLDVNGTQVWIRTLGGTSGDYATAVDVDGSGNVYVTGRYLNDSANSKTVTDFNEAPLNGKTATPSAEAFVAKLDSNGNQQWIKILGGTGEDSARSLEVDGSGNVYVTGYYNNTSTNSGSVTDFGGAALNGRTTFSSNDMFAAKLDTNGNQQWISTMGGLGTDWAYSVALDSIGNVYISGYYKNDIANTYTVVDFSGSALNGKSTSAGTDAFVAKLDASGGQVWIKTLGGTGAGEEASDIVVDGSGNVYVTGNYNNDSANSKITTDFNGAILNGKTATASNEAFVAKLDVNGNQIWIKILGGTDYEYAHALTLDDSNNVYAVGRYSNTSTNSYTVTDFSGTPLNGKGGTINFNAYATKLNSSGVQQWIKTMGGTSSEYAMGVSLDGSGNVYVAGVYTNDLTNSNIVTDFSGTTLNGKTTTISSGAFITKFK